MPSCSFFWFLSLLKAHFRNLVHNTSVLFSLHFSRISDLNKYEANFVTFYLCFDSLAETRCTYNTSRLWSDLSRCLGYWSHLNDELHQEKCFLPFHLACVCAKGTRQFITIIISVKTSQLSSANKRCLLKLNKIRSNTIRISSIVQCGHSEKITVHYTVQSVWENILTCNSRNIMQLFYHIISLWLKLMVHAGSLSQLSRHLNTTAYLVTPVLFLWDKIFAAVKT